MTGEIYEYKSIATPGSGKYTDRSSKFFGVVEQVKTREDVSTLLNSVSSDHPKARHVCYAFRILKNGIPEEFATDAGEPSGSAGAPILGVLKSHELYNSCCVVTRYFGGTKLGVPGLIEAYRSAADLAVQDAEIIDEVRSDHITLRIPLSYEPHVYQVCKKLQVPALDPQYEMTRFIITLELPTQSADAQLLEFLQQLSKRNYETLEQYLEFLEAEIQ